MGYPIRLIFPIRRYFPNFQASEAVYSMHTFALAAPGLSDFRVQKTARPGCRPPCRLHRRLCELLHFAEHAQRAGNDQQTEVLGGGGAPPPGGGGPAQVRPSVPVEEPQGSLFSDRAALSAISALVEQAQGYCGTNCGLQSVGPFLERGIMFTTYPANWTAEQRPATGCTAALTH